MKYTKLVDSIGHRRECGSIYGGTTETFNTEMYGKPRGKLGTTHGRALKRTRYKYYTRAATVSRLWKDRVTSDALEERIASAVALLATGGFQ